MLKIGSIDHPKSNNPLDSFAGFCRITPGVYKISLLVVVVVVTLAVFYCCLLTDGSRTRTRGCHGPERGEERREKRGLERGEERAGEGRREKIGLERERRDG